MKIDKNTIHLWILPTVSTHECEGLLATLSKKEENAYRAFLLEKHKQQYLTSHFLMRGILARYLSVKPQDVEFEYNDYGKPSVRGDKKLNCLEFNLSHTEGLSILGVTQNHSLGIDLEKIDLWREGLDQMVESYFAGDEIDVYNTLPASEKAPYFYRLWTIKEAFMKAQGKGLSLGLDKISITFDSDNSPKISFNGNSLDSWTIRSFSPQPGYIGAIASPGRIHSIEVFEADFQDFLKDMDMEA